MDSFIDIRMVIIFIFIITWIWDINIGYISV